MCDATLLSGDRLRYVDDFLPESGVGALWVIALHGGERSCLEVSNDQTGLSGWMDVAVRRDYASTGDGARVRSVRVRGAGNSIPGRAYRSSAGVTRLLGGQNRGFEGAREAWSFLATL